MSRFELLFTQKEIVIKNNNNLFGIPYYKIYYFFFEKPYTILVSSDNKKFYIDSPLYKIGASLPNLFIQCNKSAIVNIVYIQSITKKSGEGFLITYSKEIISISRNRFQDVSNKFLEIKKQDTLYDCCLHCTKQESCEKILPFFL